MRPRSSFTCSGLGQRTLIQGAHNRDNCFYFDAACPFKKIYRELRTGTIWPFFMVNSASPQVTRFEAKLASQTKR